MRTFRATLIRSSQDSTWKYRRCLVGISYTSIIYAEAVTRIRSSRRGGSNWYERKMRARAWWPICIWPTNIRQPLRRRDPDKTRSHVFLLRRISVSQKFYYFSHVPRLRRRRRFSADCLPARPSAGHTSHYFEERDTSRSFFKHQAKKSFLSLFFFLQTKPCASSAGTVRQAPSFLTSHAKKKAVRNLLSFEIFRK